MQAFQLINSFIFFLILFYYLPVSLSFQSQGTVSFKRPSLVSKTGKCSNKPSKLKIYISEMSFYLISPKFKLSSFFFHCFHSAHTCPVELARDYESKNEALALSLE